MRPANKTESFEIMEDYDYDNSGNEKKAQRNLGKG